LISGPTDFLGLNVYTGGFIRRGQRGVPESIPLPPDYPHAGVPWLHIAPAAIYWAIRHLHTQYQAPAYYVTENGVGYEEAPGPDGAINDLHRREYLRNYLIAVHRAVAEGIPVRGYFVWSFLDNFEWAYGYAKRFGLVYNNYATQERTPKLSAYWYRTVMTERRVV
jgi:beta-glucosidase